MLHEINYPRFVALVEKGVPLERLLRRLWPAYDFERDDMGEWTREFTEEEGDKDVCSGTGFLGKDENLLEVIYSDWQIVERYVTTHQAIGEALARLITGKCQLHPDYEFIDEETREKIYFNFPWRAGVPGPGWQGCPWGCGIFDGESGIIVKKDASEDEKIEACVDRSLAIENSDFEWIDGISKVMGYGPKVSQQMKRIKENYSKRSGLGLFYVPITGVLTHLIGTHYFFEGRKSMYRADPGFLIHALNLTRR